MFDTPKLPELVFIGGSYQELEFEIFGQGGQKIELYGYSIKWVMFPYGQQDLIVIEKNDSSEKNIKITEHNTFIVYLNSTETEGLKGRFIHRPIITDIKGNKHIPAEGDIVIK